MTPLGKNAQKRRAEKEAQKAAMRGKKTRHLFDGRCKLCGKESVDWCSHADYKDGEWRVSNDPVCHFVGMHCGACCRADWSEVDG